MSSSDAEFDPLFTGDSNDDDERVQQSYTASNPYPFPPAIEPVQQPKEKGKAKTRIFAGSADLTVGASLRIVGPDDNREALSILMWSATAADFVSVADTPTISGFRMHPGDKGPDGLGDHNGEVWVYCGLATTTVTVTWFGVSK